LDFRHLTDKFNAFDKDGNAELGYPEYVEAWKFLQQPGTVKQIKQAFDSVDVDGSSLVDRDEFVFSIMGEKAMKHGVLADMEKLERLLDVTLKEYIILKDTLGEARVDNEARSKRNQQLRERLNNMRSEVSDQIGHLMTDLLGLRPEDVLSEEEIRKH
jgi:Ca2+-binding EF-hand superfamily protein